MVKKCERFLEESVEAWINWRHQLCQAIQYERKISLPFIAKVIKSEMRKCAQKRVYCALQINTFTKIFESHLQLPSHRLP